eukprot:c22789_g1_i1 orf=356-1672(-)
MAVLAILALLVLTHSLSCDAEIKHSAFRADSRPLILFEKFGFTLQGHVSISVTNTAWMVSESALTGVPPDPSLMGFFISTDDALVQVLLEYEQKADFCVLHSDVIRRLFTFKDLDAENKYNNSFPVSDANEYSLYFANCVPHVSVSMDVTTEMYNLEGPGGKKDFLPAGQTQLPKLFFTFFLFYLVLAGIWIYICHTNWESVHLIHILMGLQVLFKALDLVSEAEDKAYVKATGTPHGWDIAFYIFSFLKGIMLFVVIVLIGTGWSFLKPFLQEKDKRILMVVIPLQVLANIANVIIDETGPYAKGWITWKQAFVVVDLLCCCAVLFPTMWSIRDLRQASQTDGKAARALMKLTLFRQYYVVLFVYIYFTRVVVFALTTITAYKYNWVSDCAAEVASLTFYIFTGYKFRPRDQNPYLIVDDEEEAAAKEALKIDGFEL